MANKEYRYYKFDPDVKKWGWVLCTKEEMDERDRNNWMKFPQFRRDFPAPTEDRPSMWSEYVVAVYYHQRWSHTAKQLVAESGWALSDMIPFLMKIDSTIGRIPRHSPYVQKPRGDKPNLRDIFGL